LRCIGCPNAALKPKIERIVVTDFERCLRNIDVSHIHTFRLFNYGEPLLHPRLAECVEQIPGQTWKASFVELSTNGQKVHWDDFEEMLKLQVVNRLVVSCDGDGTAEDYERLRPPSSWEKLILFLERARELRDRWSPATELMTRSVISDPRGRQRWNSVLLPRGWKPSFRGWMNLPQAPVNPTGRMTVVPAGDCFFMAQPEAFKGQAWHGEVALLYVDCDGSVVPCCQHPRAGVLGNLKEQTYNEIMNGDARRQFIQEMKTDRRSMPICGQCDVGPPNAEGPSFRAITSHQPPG
jgi:radical SAM protein with 4Fe4S-binding SPASM domain